MEHNYFQRAGTALTLGAGLLFGSGCDDRQKNVSRPDATVQSTTPISSVHAEMTVPDADRWRSYPATIARELSRATAFRNGQDAVIASTPYTALVFANTRCPLAARYVGKLNELQQEFGDRIGLQVVAVFPKADETPATAKTFAAEYKATFTVMLDRNAVMADALHAERSPEVFLLDSACQLIYRGSIDDSQRVRGINPTVRNDFLHDVLMGIEQDRPPKIPVTDAEGCYLDRPQLDSIYPTWSRDIGPLVEKHCATCHNDGDIASIMPLTSIEEVASVAHTLTERLEDRTMPPWRAAGPRDHFENDSRLDPNEIWAFKAWAREKMPAGEGTFKVDTERYADQRHLTRPDMVVEMLDPAGTTPWYIIPANGSIPYQTFVSPTTFKEDRWLVASEVLTQSPQSLHHVAVFILPPEDTAGSEFMAKSTVAKMIAARRFGIKPEEYENVFRFYGPNLTRQINLAGFYAPGVGFMQLSQEHGILIPKGSQLAFECHYVSNGREMKDRCSIALKFGEMPEQAEGSRIIVRTGAPRIPQLVIDPGEVKKITKTLPIFADAEIRGIRPHMHLRGKEYRAEVELPDGERKTVIHIPEWDVNWERYYVPKDPVQLPAGSKLHLTYTWDNSESNTANPAPEKKVTFGTALENEMGVSWLSIVYRNPAETAEAEAKLQQVLDDASYDERVKPGSEAAE